jgi:hypothetical protein
MNHYFLNTESKKAEKVTEGREGDFLYMAFQREDGATIVRIPILGEFLSTPFDLELRKNIQLTSPEWEKAYKLLEETK